MHGFLLLADKGDRIVTDTATASNRMPFTLIVTTDDTAIAIVVALRRIVCSFAIAATLQENHDFHLMRIWDDFHLGLLILLVTVTSAISRFS